MPLYLRCLRDVTFIKGKTVTNGKTRVHYIPNKSIVLIHTLLINELGKFKIPLPSATGWEKGSSVRKNLLRHVNGDYLFHTFWYKVDISHAYEHVSPEGLALILHELYSGVPPAEIKSYLKSFFFLPGKTKHVVTENTGGLVEGFPASPKLFNLYAEFMIDTNLREYCGKSAITYSRLGDDLLFSSDVPIGKQKKKQIQDIIALGFLPINFKKTKPFNLLKLGEDGYVVNGVGIRNRNNQAEFFYPRDRLSRLEVMLHSALQGAWMNANVIEGYMGRFRESTFGVRYAHSRRTKREERLVQMYRKYKNRLRLFSYMESDGSHCNDKKFKKLHQIFFWYCSKLKHKGDIEVFAMIEDFIQSTRTQRKATV